jgi:hypothetical protein
MKSGVFIQTSPAALLLTPFVEVGLERFLGGRRRERGA